MSLDAAEIVHLSRLLDEALDLTPPQFEAWLSGLPAESRHLGPRLREMFAEHSAGTGDDFLARGPQVDAPRDETVPLEGEVVGPYRLQRQIGRGGMGTVWLAERVEGGLKRLVALKLPRLAWGGGLAARMARERDIGALLEHPHIARLYDAGVDAAGRPFLAFEYIDGVPLDRWRVEHPSDTRARLILFVQIVRAVAYAHGRLIVHRDLKPSNVLVTSDGEAHLLDFGIAKLLDESNIDPDLTQMIGRVLTPYYASPEQIEGKAITVASDVYSLGVLLYEYLTERHPYELVGKGIGAVERAILDGEPALASTRAQEKPTARALQGELDAILAKALRRDPRQRYATADALADDLERHLDGERVLAQPDSIGYRASKILRKHRVPFVAAGTVLFVIVAGAAIAIVQAKRANDAAARAQVVKEFVVDIFKTNDPGVKQNEALRKLPAELLLERGAGLIATKFEGQPQLQAELYGIVGGIFLDMGAYDLARDYAERHVKALEAIDASPRDRAAAQLQWVRGLRAQDRLRDAEVHVRIAIDLAARDLDLRAKAQIVLAEMLLTRGNQPEVTTILDRVDQEIGTGGAPSSIRASARSLRGVLLDRGNRFDEALPLYRSALDESLAAEGPDSPATINIENTLAATLLAHYRPDDARPYREAALTALRARGTPGEIRAALDESEFAGLMWFRGQMKFDEARAIIERDRATLAEKGPLVPEDLKATVTFRLANLFLFWGDLATAQRLLDESLPSLKRKGRDALEWTPVTITETQMATLAGRHREADTLQRQIMGERHRQGLDRAHNAGYYSAVQAWNLLMDNRFDEADAILAAAPRNSTDQIGGSSAAFFRDVVANTQARVQLERGNPQAALRLVRVLDESDTIVGYPTDAWMLHGEILCAVGRRAEGLRLLEHSLATEELKVFAHHPSLAREQSVTGLCALAEGHRRRAVELAALAHASFSIQPDVSPYFKRPLERLDRMLAEGKVASTSR